MDRSTNPARRRRADELLSQMSALDHAGDEPLVERARERLRDKARAMGMRLVSFTITEEPIPDPALEALPPRDHERIAAISRDMRTNPQRHAAELERLAAKHPHIPMLRNHLAGALEASGQSDRAADIIAQTARQFPTYFFAFCNHVMILLVEGRIDEARALVETGPRGPVFTLTDFDPSRDTFHISETISHAAMVGHYMLATGRPEAAQVQLKMLRKAAPGSPQFRSLNRAMRRKSDDSISLAAELLLKAARRQLREERTTAASRNRNSKPHGATPKSR